MLISAENNLETIRTEHALTRTFDRRPMEVQLPDATDRLGEELTSLELKDDDEDNRIIVDSHFLRDIIGKRDNDKNKKKYDNNVRKLFNLNFSN